MKINQAYDIWSETYDTEDNTTRDLEKNAAQETLAKYSYAEVIELGCGTGKNTAWLVNKAQRVTAIDFSTKMLDRAKERIQVDNVQFVNRDITEPWSLPQSNADLISCSLTLEHVRSLDVIFREAFNVLRSLGKLYICELHPFRQYTGSKAKFTCNGQVNELEVHIHHVSDYVNGALATGFRLLELNEWFDERQKIDNPRLISFVFEKT